jgi:hypothetical protein
MLGMIVALFSLQAVFNIVGPPEYSKEVNDYKHLIKTLVMGNLFL